MLIKHIWRGIQMQGDILEALMPYLVDRLSRVYGRSGEYRQAVEKESRAYEGLKRGLEVGQGDQLDEYFAATRATAGICEKLAYQQGIKEFFSFCVSMVSEKGGGE